MTGVISYGIGRRIARAALALAIAWALTFSFLHGGSIAFAGNAPSDSAVVQADVPHSPAHKAVAHGDHCLQHLQAFEAAPVLGQRVLMAGRCVPTTDSFVVGVDGKSHFRPPRVADRA